MSRISLTRYLVEEQRLHGTIPAELRLLLEVVSRACKAIANTVHKGALTGVLGSAGSDNIQGEMQQKLDVIANEVLLEANEWGGHLAAMASEEMDSFYETPHRYPVGEYLLLFDPLDGSSNIDANISIGTIFSVLKNLHVLKKPYPKQIFSKLAKTRWLQAMLSMAHKLRWCSPSVAACKCLR